MPGAMLLGQQKALPQTLSVIAAPDDRYYPGYRQGLKQVGPRLVETRVAFSTYGVPLNLTAGQPRSSGNIIWARPLVERPETTTVDGVESTIYMYYGTFQIVFSEPLDKDISQRFLLRAWADGHLVVDNTVSGRRLAQGFRFKFYDGVETQDPDPTVVGFEGAGNVPAYRGVLSMVVSDLPLLAFNNKLPAITAEFGDAADLSGALTSIVATGESNNNGQTFVDSDTMRSYVGNNNEKMYIYSLISDTFVGGTKINLGGVVQDGARETGFEPTKPWAYIPWLKRIIAFPEFGVELTPFLARPDTGSVSASAIGIVKSPALTPAAIGRIKLTGADNLTLAAWPASSPQLSIIAIGADGLSMWRVDNRAQFLAQDYDEFSVLCFAGNVNSSKLMISKSSSDSVDMITVTSARAVAAHAENGNLPVTDDYIAYDGVETTTVHAMRWIEKQDALLIVYTSGEVRLVDLTSLTNIWRITASPLEDLPPQALEGDFTNETYAWVSPTTELYELNLKTGIVTEYTIPIGVFDYNFTFSHSMSYSVVGIGQFTGQFKRYFYRESVPDSLTLKRFIELVAIKAGYDLADVQVDASVDDLCQGALITEPTSLNEILEKLKTVFGLTVNGDTGVLVVKDTQTDWTTADFTVTDADLVNTESESYRWRLEEPIQLPREVTLTYIDPDIGYQWSSMTVGRNGTISTVTSTNQNGVKLPLIMTADQAKLLCHRMLWNTWSARMSHAFTLPRTFLKMEPGDIIQFNVDGEEIVVRAVDIDYKANLNLEIQAQDFQDWEEFFVDAYAGLSYNPEIKGSTVTQIFYLDIPTLDDGDDVSAVGDLSRYYYVIAPGEPTTNFVGATAFESLNQGKAWDVLEHSDISTPVGILNSDFGRPETPHATDYDNSLSITFMAGNEALLASITREEMLAGGNLAVVGNVGRWEIIRFTTVTLELDGTYTLTEIMRGCRGTSHINQMIIQEAFQGVSGGGGASSLAPSGSFNTYIDSPHRAGDYFILLDDSNLKKGTHTASVDQGRNTIFATSNKGANSTEPRKVVANDLAPRAANSMRVTRDSFGKLTVTWRPCYRTGFTWESGAQTPHLAPGDLDKFEVLVYLDESVTPWENSTRLQDDPDFLAGVVEARFDDRVSQLFKLGDGGVNDWNVGGAVGSRPLYCFRHVTTPAEAAAREYEFPHPIYDSVSHPVAYGILADVDLLTEFQDYLAYDYVWVAVRQFSTKVEANHNFDRAALVPIALPALASDPEEAISQEDLDTDPRIGHTLFYKCFIEDV